MALTPDQFRRYRRHVILPELGDAGQEKLLAAKVLIVDDEKQIRTIVARLLRDEGCEVEAVESGEKCLKVAV
ncbi:MAG: hypothetical protein QF773_05530, partial [Lentisphaeria bacterium]|nr:hypothetical protein [Lentisphaeria bacterium]